MPQSPFIWQSRIRFGDTDASGRVFYISLLRQFEAAEHELLRAMGCPYNLFQEPRVDFPRVHVECDYTSPLVFDDPIDTAVTVERVGGSSFTFGFAITTAGRLAARGKLTVVAMDPKTHKSTPLPDKLRATLSAYAA
ncbi:MAG TPA: thioesterase family protein [Bryobacteraceae bacterium]|nr:thioesterase family protein [Bryobacteraceae bacterium]